MADALDTIAILAAVNSDPVKAQRLTELAEMLEKIKAERQALEDRSREVDAASEMSRQTLMQARAAQEDLTAREHALASEREGLSSAIQSHNNEKQCFEAVRSQVETDHEYREAKIRAEEDRQTAKHTELTDRETLVTAREQAAQNLLAGLDRKYAALKSAFDA